MTVRYSEDVAYAKPFRFVRLLFRWRGSFYKLIVYEFTIYFIVYMAFNVIHSFVLTDEQEAWFSDFCAQLGRMSGYVVASLTFCLGFFIQQVYRRFCYHFQVVPWPDGFAFLVSVNVRGHDNRGRLLRRTMVRYAVASIILTWMNFSARMKVLFPDLDCLVMGGFLTENEVALLKTVGRPAWRQMVAVSWCAAVVKRARMEGRIEDDFAFNAILRELDILRMRCRRLISQNNRPTPLAHLHTVIIGVYSFFSIAAVAGSHRLQTQKLLHLMDESPGDVWILRLISQLITMLQFSICAGVLAISRALINPFGMDDCNIDVEEIVKRHLSQAYLIVDELHSLIPELDDPHEVPNSSTFQSSEAFEVPSLRLSRASMQFDDAEDPFGRRSSAGFFGYMMSVAPKHKDHKQDQSQNPPSASLPVSNVEAARNRFLQVRSESKLERLLSFRKLN